MNTELSTALEAEMSAFYLDHPEYFHPFLMKEREDLFASPFRPAQVEDNTFALFSEILAPRLGFDRNDAPQKKYYDYICKQIYCFFMARGYHEEHFTAVALKEMLITTTAVHIIQWTGWNAALVTAAVTLVLSSVVKIGIRAWCQYYEEQHPEHKYPEEK